MMHGSCHCGAVTFQLDEHRDFLTVAIRIRRLDGADTWRYLED